MTPRLREFSLQHFLKSWPLNRATSQRHFYGHRKFLRHCCYRAPYPEVTDQTTSSRSPLVLGIQSRDILEKWRRFLLWRMKVRDEEWRQVELQPSYHNSNLFDFEFWAFTDMSLFKLEYNRVADTALEGSFLLETLVVIIGLYGSCFSIPCHKMASTGLRLQRSDATISRRFSGIWKVTV